MNQETISRYQLFLEKVLTPSRLVHSYGVMQVMEELVPIYELDQDKAAAAALLHDAGKDLVPAQQKRLIQEAGLAIEPYSDLEYTLYLHGPVGAVLVQKELGITDPQILNAISTHTFCGKKENLSSPFIWCLRFSDLLEPNRRPSEKQLPLELRWSQEGIDKLRRLVVHRKLPEAILFQTGWLIRMFEEKNFPVHPNMRSIFQELSSTLHVDNSFW